MPPTRLAARDSSSDDGVGGGAPLSRRETMIAVGEAVLTGGAKLAFADEGDMSAYQTGPVAIDELKADLFARLDALGGLSAANVDTRAVDGIIERLILANPTTRGLESSTR